jgi:hypothetical protein
VALLQDRSAEGTRLLHEATRLAAVIGAEAMLLRLRLLMGTAARRAGTPGVARAVSTSALATATLRHHRPSMAVARLERALLAEESGERKAMLEEVDAAAEALAELPRHPLWIYVSVLRACASHGERGFETRWAIARARGLPDVGAPDDLRPALARLESALRREGEDALADSVAATRASPLTGAILGLAGV